MLRRLHNLLIVDSFFYALPYHITLNGWAPDGVAARGYCNFPSIPIMGMGAPCAPSPLVCASLFSARHLMMPKVRTGPEPIHFR